jgi:signal transduction histidine kinase
MEFSGATGLWQAYRAGGSSARSAPPKATVWYPEAVTSNQRADLASLRDEVVSLRRLSVAISHEVRNPLVEIRTFSKLLPERFDDAEFRSRFAAVLDEQLSQIERAIEHLAVFSALGPVERAPVDVAELLDEMLEERRDEVQARRLIVLRELDREQSRALGSPAQLRFAFDALLGRALELVPEGGELYLAARYLADGLRGGPCYRVLLRFQQPEEVVPAADVEGRSPASTPLEVVLADAVVRSLGGSMILSPTESRETVVLIDLPTWAAPD